MDIGWFPSIKALALRRRVATGGPGFAYSVIDPSARTTQFMGLGWGAQRLGRILEQKKAQTHATGSQKVPIKRWVQQLAKAHVFER
ncbi:hypothetical protein OIN59_16980 [Acidovorax sp. D2M1]|uniref:Uncharacterized protein n=1 Tax=Acidovorax benzenivorans TaxID=2987520 RepID=A0ABT5RZK3_9BURK|nr:hypothetical protein [Acidovorax benzenivorans]MDD2179134.1 hypothetical protein [Acidovorax benzenivorans]